MRAPLLIASLLSAGFALSACDVAPPPPTDPDAAIATAAKARADAAAQAAAGHHEMQDAIDSVDKRDEAAHANDPVEAADKKREEDLKAAGG
jgi:hypothetical protein